MQATRTSNRATPPGDAAQELEFSQALATLDQLLQTPQLRARLAAQECVNAAQVYTTLPTIWLLITQRLGGGLTLSQAVSELLRHHRDLLPDNKRVRENTLSENNSSYNVARKKLPLAKIQAFARAVCDHLASTAQAGFLGRRVFILDGTTITLPPTPELRERFPPATNQYGQTVWPIAQLLVAHELHTGCATVPQVAPMYGPNNRSEAEMARDVMNELPAQSLILADSGFGIFSTAFHATRTGHRFLFRLTKSRFQALQRAAQLMDQQDGRSTHHLVWQPSSKDRKTSPELPDAAAVECFLHVVRLPNGEELYLVGNIEVEASSAAQLYQSRYDVEFDIRDLKVTMDTEHIRAKSYDTLMKELLGSVIAFNLVMQFRQQAAQRARVKPRRLSFSGVWTSFQDHLLRRTLATYQAWLAAYEQAIHSASRKRLPNRTQPRSSPRVSHPRRPKTTKFEKSLRKKPPTSPNAETVE